MERGALSSEGWWCVSGALGSGKSGAGKKGTCRCSGRGAVARGGLSELRWMTL